jgi:hypothetical protein
VLLPIYCTALLVWSATCCCCCCCCRQSSPEYRRASIIVSYPLAWWLADGSTTQHNIPDSPCPHTVCNSSLPHHFSLQKIESPLCLENLVDLLSPTRSYHVALLCPDDTRRSARSGNCAAPGQSDHFAHHDCARFLRSCWPLYRSAQPGPTRRNKKAAVSVSLIGFVFGRVALLLSIRSSK